MPFPVSNVGHTLYSLGFKSYYVTNIDPPENAEVIYWKNGWAIAVFDDLAYVRKVDYKFLPRWVTHTLMRWLFLDLLKAGFTINVTASVELELAEARQIAAVRVNTTMPAPAA